MCFWKVYHLPILLLFYCVSFFGVSTSSAKSLSPTSYFHTQRYIFLQSQHSDIQHVQQGWYWLKYSGTGEARPVFTSHKPFQLVVLDWFRIPEGSELILCLRQHDQSITSIELISDDESVSTSHVQRQETFSTFHLIPQKISGKATIEVSKGEFDPACSTIQLQTGRLIPSPALKIDLFSQNKPGPDKRDRQKNAGFPSSSGTASDKEKENSDSGPFIPSDDDQKKKKPPFPFLPDDDLDVIIRPYLLQLPETPDFLQNLPFGDPESNISIEVQIGQQLYQLTLTGAEWQFLVNQNIHTSIELLALMARRQAQYRDDSYLLLMSLDRALLQDDSEQTRQLLTEYHDIPPESIFIDSWVLHRFVRYLLRDGGAHLLAPITTPETKGQTAPSDEPATENDEDSGTPSISTQNEASPLPPIEPSDDGATPPPPSPALEEASDIEPEDLSVLANINIEENDSAHSFNPIRMFNTLAEYHLRYYYNVIAQHLLNQSIHETDAIEQLNELGYFSRGFVFSLLWSVRPISEEDRTLFEKNKGGLRILSILEKEGFSGILPFLERQPDPVILSLLNKYSPKSAKASQTLTPEQLKSFLLHAGEPSTVSEEKKPVKKRARNKKKRQAASPVPLPAVAAELQPLLRALSELNQQEITTVLYGSQSIRAQLHVLYNRDDVIRPDDWDFLIDRHHLPRIFQAFHLPQEITTDLLLAANSMSCQALQEFTHEQFEFSLRCSEIKTMPQVLTVRVLDSDRQILGSIDFTFVYNLPDYQQLVFDEIGTLPVIDIDTLLEKTYLHQNNRVDLKSKYQSVFSSWRDFEEEQGAFKVNPRLKIKLELLLKALHDSESWAAGSLEELMPKAKKKASSKKGYAPAVLPRLSSKTTAEGDTSRETLKSNLRNKYKRSQKLKSLRQNDLDQACRQFKLSLDNLKRTFRDIQIRTFDQYQMNHLKKLSLKELYELFLTTTQDIESLWEYERSATDSIVIQPSGPLTVPCARLELEHRTFLFKVQNLVRKSLKSLFEEIEKRESELSPDFINLGAQAKALSVILALNCRIQGEEIRSLQQILEESVSFKDHQNIDVANALSNLFEFLFTHYSKLTDHHQSLFLKSLLKSWKPHIQYLNRQFTPDLAALASYNEDSTKNFFFLLMQIQYGLLWDDMEPIQKLLPVVTKFIDSMYPVVKHSSDSSPEMLAYGVMLNSFRRWGKVFLAEEFWTDPEKAGLSCKEALHFLKLLGNMFYLSVSFSEPVKTHREHIERLIVQRGESVEAASQELEQLQKAERPLSASKQPTRKGKKGHKRPAHPSAKIRTQTVEDSTEVITQPLLEYWRIQLSYIRSLVKKQNYTTATLRYEELLESDELPPSERTIALVELSENRLLSIQPDIDEFLGMRVRVMDYHSQFSEALDGGAGVSVKKDQVTNLAAEVANCWNRLSREIQTALRNIEQAILSLHPDATETDYYKEALITSIKSLVDFSSKAQETSKLMTEVLGMRHQWLKKILFDQPPKETVRKSGVSIKQLLEKIKAQQISQEKLHQNFSDVLKRLEGQHDNQP